MHRALSFRLRAGVIVLAMVAALPCFAGESAVLRNGFSIRHERREIIGATTRLYLNADGSSYVDVPTAEIDHFEEAGEPASGAKFAVGHATSSAAQKNFQAARRVFSQAELSSYVNAASGHYQLDPDLVASVIRAESGFNVRAVSRKGAQGLMQLMPQTASQLGVPNAFDPQANVEGGTRYLRELLERYNYDLIKALAAYNAGPQRVEQFGGVPPYYETRAYVARVVKDFNKKKVAEQKAERAHAKSSNNKQATSSGKPHGSQPQVQANARTTEGNH